jgi:murein DD-endopeptidase MepM/ murein hydrolase activator NlpD
MRGGTTLRTRLSHGAAALALLAALAIAAPGPALAEPGKIGAAPSFKWIAAPKSDDRVGFSKAHGHASPLTGARDKHALEHELERFDHVVIHGADGRIERILILGAKKAAPIAPNGSNGGKAVNGIKKAALPGQPDRSPAQALLKPGMRPLRWPLDNTLVTSGYGPRRHPILGGSRNHLGVDLRASAGTPIRAAADGVVLFKGHRGSYGRYIRLQHDLGLETAYGHMKGYHKSAGAGSRVRRGDIIGYVGSSGLSTGPHLHFEVIMDGRQVDPLQVAPPAIRWVSVQ